MDIILYNIVGCLISIIIGYLFGSIPTGIILCKVLFNADPRDGGSKNSGGTNVGRLFGKKVGLLTIILDAIKTFLPMLIVFLIIKYSKINETLLSKYGQPLLNNGLLIMLLASLGASIGHCWPIFAHFKGGKAVSSYAGFVASTCWLNLVVGFATFMTTLKISKHVSLSSIIGAVTTTVISWILFIISKVNPAANMNLFFMGAGHTILWAAASLEYAVISTLISGILIIRHSSNIKRLANHTESKIKWMK